MGQSYRIGGGSEGGGDKEWPGYFIFPFSRSIRSPSIELTTLCLDA